MFTWICQQCGREVPPAYAECPTCAERKAIAAGVQPPPPLKAPAPPPPPPQPPQQQTYYAPPPPPPQATYAPPPPPPPPSAPLQYSPAPVYAAPPPTASRGMPSWLVAILAFAGLGVILGGVYYFRSNGNTSSKASASLEKPSIPAEGSSKHPYAKFLEVTGIRLLEEGTKVRVRFAAVNHSAADMAGLAIRGELIAESAKGEDTAVASFDAKIGNLGPNESKDFTVPATTKLRAYELPDWQFLKARVEITSPK